LAKRGRPRKSVGVEAFAEDLGRFLGTAEAKATSWLDQRKAILAQLTAVRDKASSLIHELTGARMAAAVGIARRGRPGRPKSVAVVVKKERKVKWTAAQRRAVAVRMKNYWADRKAAEKKK
jgi:hypothetical protein